MSKAENLNIFINKTNYKLNQVIKYEPIHQGYTNQNYLIQTNDDKSYILRISLKKHHDFKNELNAYLIYGKIKFIYFDVETGIYLKEKIPGNHPDLSNKHVLSLIIQELKSLHLKTSELQLKSQNWLDYLSYNQLNQRILDKFYQLISIVKDDPKTLTHHDLNHLNILINDQTITLIDWEWARFDSPYFDWATLALNDAIDEQFLVQGVGLNQTKLQHYKFLILVYSHMWCFYMNTITTLKLKDGLEIKINQMVDKI